MNHLPFDWSDAVDDNHVVAHFIGGAWDGKTYTIPRLPEWKIANIRPLKSAKYINKPPDKFMSYDIAVYKCVMGFEGEAIYWLSEIENGDE